MNYTIYKQNGEISRCVSVNNIEIQLLDGEQYIVGHFDSTKFYVSDGVAVAIPEHDQSAFYFDFDTKTVVAFDVDIESITRQVKADRNALLLQSDWTQLPDVPEKTRLKWQEYRQALRDITLQEGFPENIIWPTKPE